MYIDVTLDDSKGFDLLLREAAKKALGPLPLPPAS